MNELVKAILLERYEEPVSADERNYRMWLAENYPQGQAYVPGQDHAMRLLYSGFLLRQEMKEL